MSVSSTYRARCCHETLGASFFDPVTVAQFPKHDVKYKNHRWAAQVGLDTLTAQEWVQHFAMFDPLPGNQQHPLALRYHGHQFHNYNPDIGDGRGFLYAQVLDVQTHRLLDLGTKGSGRTPWSRNGDGRLTLKGGVREVLATAYLEALGVNTSKSFSLVETGDSLHRLDEPSPARSSVLVRLSHSHIRIGTFQRLAFFGQTDELKTLVAYCLEHYAPALWKTVSNQSAADQAFLLFTDVVEKTAWLGAEWMAAGFVHGVLNTDNINITGESFDYGPYRFLPRYDPFFVAADFDYAGLYAYANQPAALIWTLNRFAEALSACVGGERLQASLAAFVPVFEKALNLQIVYRLGLKPKGFHQDRLAATVFRFLEDSAMPFEGFFFDWFGGMVSEHRAKNGPRAAFYTGEAFAPLDEAFKSYTSAFDRVPDDGYFASEKPGTLLIDEINDIWAAIDKHDDWTLFDLKLDAIDVQRQALNWS